MKKTGIPVTRPAMVWALAPAWSTRWKNRMATYAVDPTPGPEQERPSDEHLGVGAGHDVPELVQRGPGPDRAVGLGPVGGVGGLTHQQQYDDAHRHQNHRRHLEGKVPGGRIVLLPRGDHRSLDGPTGDGAEHRGQEERLDPAAPTEDLGHHGHVGEGEGGRGLTGDQDHQDQGPVATDDGEHPCGDPHDDEAAGHVRACVVPPDPGSVAEPPGHGEGEPADQPVGRQGEGDGQGSRGPLLYEQGDDDAGYGQVGPGADQADGQADEAADAGCVDGTRWPTPGPEEPGLADPGSGGPAGSGVGGVRSSGPPVTLRCLSRRRRPLRPVRPVGLDRLGHGTAVRAGRRCRLGSGPLRSVDLHIGQIGAG